MPIKLGDPNPAAVRPVPSAKAEDEKAPTNASRLLHMLGTIFLLLTSYVGLGSRLHCPSQWQGIRRLVDLVVVHWELNFRLGLKSHLVSVILF